MEKIGFQRWLRALTIAKVMFEADGYFTDYLEQIEDHVRKLIERLDKGTSRRPVKVDHKRGGLK